MDDENNKKRNILFWTIPLIVLVILFSIKFDTKIYVGFETDEYEGLESIAVSLKLDGETIFVTDSLRTAFFVWNYGMIEMPLRMGIHTIEVSTSTTGAELKKNVFILFNHYIMIEYWDGREKFTVRTGFNPFLFM